MSRRVRVTFCQGIWLDSMLSNWLFKRSKGREVSILFVCINSLFGYKLVGLQVPMQSLTVIFGFKRVLPFLFPAKEATQQQFISVGCAIQYTIYGFDLTLAEAGEVSGGNWYSILMLSNWFTVLKYWCTIWVLPLSVIKRTVGFSFC